MGATGKTFKQTTIFIALGKDTSVYGSAEAIPQTLRKRLLRSTRGMNSATILIADRGGREEIRKMLEGQPNSLDGTLRMSYFQKPKAARGAGATAGAAGPIESAREIVKPGAGATKRRGAEPIPAEAAKTELAKTELAKTESGNRPPVPARSRASGHERFDWRRPVEYALPAALGIALWFLFTLR